MDVNKSIFKAYDLRGKFPQEFDEKTAYYLGKALVGFFNSQGKTFGIGYDLMSSSLKLARITALGIKDAGGKIKNLGMLATPVFYFAIPRYKLHGGIIFTASHLAKDFAGAKIVNQDGVAISFEGGLSQIKNLIAAMPENLYKKPHKAFQFQKHQNKKLLQEYINNVMRLLDERGGKKSLRIIADAGNGMAGPIIKKLKIKSAKLKIKVIPLFCNLDARFRSREPDPLKPEALEKLSAAVAKFHADFGCAFDPDSDRVIFTDEKGVTQSSAVLLSLIAKYLLQENPGAKILFTANLSPVVEETIQKYGGVPIISRIGHAIIKERMAKENILFGGEVSGHFAYKFDGFRESPFWLLLKICQIVANSGKAFSEILKEFQSYVNSGEINFTVADKQTVIERVKNNYSAKAIKILTVDGISMHFNDWWFNLRLSNTENLVRLNAESKGQKILEEKIKEISAIITQE